MKKTKIWPSAMNYYNGFAYFMDSCSNALFSLSLNDYHIELVTQFSEECYYEKRLFSSLVIEDDKIFCVPHMAKSLGIYDIKEDKTYSIEFPEKLKNTSYIFKQGLYDSGTLYLLGYYGTRNIWSYDVKNNHFEELVIDNSPGVFLAGCVVDNHLLIVSRCSNNIWKINTISKKVTKIETNIDDAGFVDIRIVNNKIVLTSFNNSRLYYLNKNRLDYSGIKFSNDFLNWPHGGFGTGCKGDYYVVSNIRDGLSSLSKDGRIMNKKYNCSGINEYCRCNLFIAEDSVIVWLDDNATIIVCNPEKNQQFDITLETDEMIEIKLDSTDGQYLTECDHWDFRRYIDVLGSTQ